MTQTNENDSAPEGFRDPAWRHNMLVLWGGFGVAATILAIIWWVLS